MSAWSPTEISVEANIVCSLLRWTHKLVCALTSNNQVILEGNGLEWNLSACLTRVPFTMFSQYCMHISMHTNNLEDVKGKI